MIKYTKGWKYQLEELHAAQTPVVGCTVINDYFQLLPDGKLKIYRGYAWDGPSGPTYDTKSSMSPSLVHDVFCQCMRAGWVSYDKWQNTINEFFRKQCVECGMWEWRAALWYAAVELGDAGNPKQGPDRPILTAP